MTNTRFKIELLDDFPETIESSKQTVKTRARIFTSGYLQRGEGRTIDRDMEDFFQSLNTGCYWRVLSRIDGNNSYHSPDNIQIKMQKRAWARKRFDDRELQDILNISVNSALLVPFYAGFPGHHLGHTILYQELVEKSDSMFHGTVDKALVKKLNNGRLWENLSGLTLGTNWGVSYPIVQDALLQRPKDLDPHFAEEGLKIFYRNNSHGKEAVFNLSHLSNRAIDSYFNLMKSIDQEHPIRTKEMAQLLGPYVSAAIGTVSEATTLDIGYPRFGKDLDQRLNDPFLAPYIKSSNPIRNRIAHDLANQFEYMKEWDDSPTHIFRVFSQISNKSDMLGRMAYRINMNDFISAGKEAGYRMPANVTIKAKDLAAALR